MRMRKALTVNKKLVPLTEGHEGHDGLKTASKSCCPNTCPRLYVAKRTLEVALKMARLEATLATRIAARAMHLYLT